MKEKLENELKERILKRALTLKRQSSVYYKPPTAEELKEQEDKDAEFIHVIEDHLMEES